MSKSAPTNRGELNSRARELYRALKRNEIDDETYATSIVDLLHGPLCACIRHQLWRLGCWDMETEEVFNEAMLRFLDNEPNFNEKPLLPWFAAVTRSVIIDHIRKRIREGQHTVFDERTDGYRDIPAGESSRFLAQFAVKNALASIPEEDSEILYIHYYEGRTQEELASFLNVERWEVDLRIRNARQLLRKNRHLIELKKRRKDQN